MIGAVSYQSIIGLLVDSAIRRFYLFAMGCLCRFRFGKHVQKQITSALYTVGWLADTLWVALRGETLCSSVYTCIVQASIPNPHV